MAILVFICLICLGTSTYLIIKAISTHKLIKMLTGTILFAISMTFGHSLAVDIFSTNRENAPYTTATVYSSGPSSSPVSYVSYEHK